MNLSDSFYLALCMTVLILGVVYWFWTQNQYIQRKVNLLENIIYDLRSSMNGHPESMGGGGSVEPNHEGSGGLAPARYPPAPSSVADEDDDLLHNELTAEILAAADADLSGSPFMGGNEPVAASSAAAAAAAAATSAAATTVHHEMLQPGGVGSGSKEELVADSALSPSVLEGMTLKQLKQLAERNNITLPSGVRKPQLIAALRTSAGSSNAVSTPMDLPSIPPIQESVEPFDGATELS